MTETAAVRAYPVVAVVGPTGSGKSALAESIAVALGGEIVSADSMQVYRSMDIGTAKTPPGERRVPYHCIDLVSPGEPYSAALFQRDARSGIEDIRSREKVAVLCGGTGLYVRAALDDFAFAEGDQVENPVRQRYEQLAEELGAEGLYALLAERDPASAELIHPNNVRRVVRALEMLEEGVSYAQQQSGFSVRETVYPAVFIALDFPREELYSRIDARVDAMLEAGLLQEVASLLEAGFRDALTAAQAIGYKELVPVIEGARPLDEAVEEIKRSSRRYAKRQLTWFRADPRIHWLPASGVSHDELLAASVALIESNETSR